MITFVCLHKLTQQKMTSSQASSYIACVQGYGDAQMNRIKISTESDPEDAFNTLYRLTLFGAKYTFLFKVECDEKTLAQIMNKF